MSSKVEVPIEDAAVEWGKNLPLEDEKNPTTEGGGIGANLEGKEQHEIDPQAQNCRNDKKTLVPIEAEEPASEGSSAAIKNREQISLSNKAGSYLPSDVVQQLLAIPEEEAASKKPELKMKKEKERKTAKLVKIKKEQQLGGVDKTQFPVEPHMLGDGEQAHSLCVPEEEDASRKLQMKKKEKKRKRIELEEIKKDEQLGSADKTQFPVEPHMPGDAEKAHSLCVPEEEGASKNLQMNKKEKKRKRMELEKIKKEEPWRWHATFCTVLTKNSLHKGFLMEEPFSIVEYSGFVKFVKSLNPMFTMVSRTTVKDDCMESYKEQRSMLREMLKNYGARVSLTADMWTSNQRLGYLCVTCHFIDKTWKMQKRILRFCMMETPHSGFRMYNVMLKSLQYWNIEDKICSITLDNASVNGKMMDYLKENLTKKQMLACGIELLHIRCAAHVLNLIVQDGLFVMKGPIDKIRASVNYVRSSQTREQLFDDIVKQLGIICEKEPSIDVATRWNSTYLMIESSLPYMEAFDELVNQDRQFKYAPSAEDWKMAKEICSLLKVFFEATKVVSGSSYPTANRYFHEIWSVKMLLKKHAMSKNKVIASMVSKMQKKFDKYWTESYLANCIPVILDPRYKLELIEFRIKQAFGDKAGDHLEKVEMVLNSLFEEYYNKMGESFADHSGREFHVDEVAAVDNPLADWEAHLKVKKKQATSELDTYLTGDLHPPKKDFDILEWWEMHSINYPVLSCIARDVLAIQASTVASESSFSAGGRIISDHRTRLKSDTVEGLLCLQDWLNANDTKPTNKDAEEEVYLEFHQASKCHKEGRTRLRSFVPSSSPLSSPASSSSLSPSISPDQG